MSEKVLEFYETFCGQWVESNLKNHVNSRAARLILDTGRPEVRIEDTLYRYKPEPKPGLLWYSIFTQKWFRSGMQVGAERTLLEDTTKKLATIGAEVTYKGDRYRWGIPE